MADHWREHWDRARRPTLRVLKVVAFVAFLYELAFNAFLLSGGLGRLITSGDPDALLVSYRLGWSIWPGFVHARGLRIRSKDNSVEFDLRIERCEFHCVLTDLLRQRFRVTTVTGEGIQFLSRMRIEVPDATPKTLEALPRIEGLEEVPFKGPDKPPPDDAHYALWTVELDRVEARDVTEVWVDTLRYSGRADIVGGFMLKPTRWASVGPAVAYFHEGAVHSAQDVIVTGVHGEVRTTIDGFDPRSTGGAEILHQASGSVSLKVDFPTAAFVRRWIDDESLRVSGGAGDASIDVALDHGRLVAPTRVVAHLGGIDVSSPRAVGGGDLDLTLDVSRGHAPSAPPNDDMTLEGQLILTKVHVAPPESAVAPIRAQQCEVSVRSSDLDLVDRPFADAALSARLPAAQVPDARVVGGWLPADGSIRVLAGLGTMSATLDVARGVARGGAILALDGFRAALSKDESVGGSIRAHLELRRWELATGAADVSGTRLEVRDVQATGGTEGWWANVSLPASLLGLRGKTSWRSNLVADARDTRPFVTALLASAHAPAWLGPVVTGGDLHLTAQLSMAGDRMDVRSLAATAGALHLDGTFARRGDKSRAVALVGSGPLSVALETHEGGTAVQLVDAGNWYRQHADAAEGP